MAKDEAAPAKTAAAQDSKQQTDEMAVFRAELTRLRADNEQLARQHAEELKAERAEVSRLRADNEQLARRAADLGERAGQLAKQNVEATERIAELRMQISHAMQGPAQPALGEVPSGHRRIITIQPYSYDGEGRQPRMVPKDHVMCVPEKDYLSDKLRKFPHLLDFEEHTKLQKAKADAEAQPVNHSREALNQVLAQVDAVLELRKQQQAELAKIITRPENLATQLTQ